MNIYSIKHVILLNMKIQPNRSDIDLYFAYGRMDSIAEVDGIVVVLWKHETHGDCLDYIRDNVAEVPGRRHNWNMAPPGFRMVYEPLEGDIVAYFLWGRASHIGVKTGNGRVTSKWGKSHVLNHPLELVPTIYGNEVRFYRPIKDAI